MKKTCCFTGHRKIPKEIIPKLREQVFNQIITLAVQGVTRFACVPVAGPA